jgi:hypothetical protein
MVRLTPDGTTLAQCPVVGKRILENLRIGEEASLEDVRHCTLLARRVANRLSIRAPRA